MADKTKSNITKLNSVSAVLTILSIVAIILESVPEFVNQKTLFNTIEFVTVAFFTFEYLVHLKLSKRKLSYVFSFWGLLDLLCILPTYLTVANLTFLKSARALRLLRLARMLRLAKLARSKEASSVLHNKVGLYFLSLFTSVVVLGSLLYVVANGAAHYESIPLSMVQSAKLLVGGIGYATIDSVAGEITIILSRFIGLALFGLLISVVGSYLNDLLFGKDQ